MNASTTITRNVAGINILISCHGNIAPAAALHSYRQPDRIQVADNTTFHFYSEPGGEFYCPRAFDIQQQEVCSYILGHNNQAIGINFSVSNGHIPNFVISAEPNQQTFMSRVVVCTQVDGTSQPRKLLNINEHIRDSPIAQARHLLSRTRFNRPVHHHGLTYPFLTLQEILNQIRNRVLGLQAIAARLRVSTHVNYHCMFCQDGIVPEFWQNARELARTADNALLRQPSFLPRTPLRHMPETANDAGTPGRVEERQRFNTGRVQGLFQPPEFTTPNGRGRGAGSMSSLVQTFNNTGAREQSQSQSQMDVDDDSSGDERLTLLPPPNNQRQTAIPPQTSAFVNINEIVRDAARRSSPYRRRRSPGRGAGSTAGRGAGSTARRGAGSTARRGDGSTSPDFNPIEEAFNNLKKYLRRHK